MHAEPSYLDTAIIDAALATVHATLSQLGTGYPTLGTEYESASKRLRVIADDMARAFRLAPWAGPAGEIFAVESLALVSAVVELAELDRNVTFATRRQAGGVMQARSGLHEIAADLEKTKAAAIALANSGNRPESLALQEAAAVEATSKGNVVVEKLSAITTAQALKMAQLRTSLVILERQLGGGFVPIGPQRGGIMSVAPAELGCMAAGIAECSTRLAAAWSVGPWILEEVRLTHGSGLTEAFNSTLAEFETLHGRVLATIWSEVELRATSLARAAGMYEQRDTAAADMLQGPTKRQKLGTELHPRVG